MSSSTDSVIQRSTWTRMLAKARSEGIQVRQLGSGMWITTSGSDADAAYAVDLRECECPGHAYHGYCKHRAALAAKLGHLRLVTSSDGPPSSATPPDRSAPHSARSRDVSRDEALAAA